MCARAHIAASAGGLQLYARVRVELAQEIERRVNDPQRLAAVRATGLLDTLPDEPFDRLARLAAVTLEAPLAFVTVVDERRSFWKACIGVELAAPEDRQNAVQESFCQYVIGLDAELVVGDAASDPRTRDNPSIAAMGVAAWAGFPLRSPEGEALGSFCVVDTRVRTWTDRDVAVLRSLADAAAGEIALRAEAERSAALARTLQQVLLPPVVPRVPGLEIGTVYRAAGAGDEVLGDFFDVFETNAGRWNVVLGDVCGKGAEAAQRTGLARWTVRAGAIREQRPSAVLDLLNRALLGDESSDRFVTAVLATLDPHDGGFAATICSGGHVQPVLRAGGACRALPVHGSLLGVTDRPQLTDAELELTAGDVLVLCTDGVTEMRGRDGDRFGEDRLRAVVADATGDAQAIADAVLEAAVAFSGGEESQDDVAIVGLRVGAPAAGPGRR